MVAEMKKLQYGINNQVSFRDENEYYYALGYLANSENAEIRWENNEDQGAWGSEGRIHCLVPSSGFPQCFRFTAGRGNVFARINCNEYVACLVKNHSFNYNSRGQNISKILETVPEKYRESFEKGYGATINIMVPYKSKQDQPYYQEPQYETNATVNIQLSTQNNEEQPILVEVGEIIIHKTFGQGVVYKGNENII